MSQAARAKPRILIAHQWKAQRGLYGADRVLLRILRELAPVAELVVVVESEGEFTDVARAIPCKVFVRELGVLRRRQMNPLGLVRQGWRLLMASLSLARLIRHERLELVFTSTVSVVSAAVAAKITRRPHIWFVQEILGGYDRILSIVVRHLSSKIIVVSKASGRSIHPRPASLGDRLVVAYPGVDARRFDGVNGAALRQEFCRDQATILILHVARLHYWKGQDYFLDALQELKRRGVANFQALVAGDVYPGYEDLRERLHERGKAAGLESCLTFLGHRDDTDALFTAADIAVSPSILPEPCALVIVEAMAARRPVIATATGGSAELIEDGLSGILIPHNRPEVFADRLEQLINDAPLRRRLGEAARVRVELHFDAAKFDAQVRGVVASLVNRT